MQYRISSCGSGIYLFETDHLHDLGMTFLRPQEFYESRDSMFRGNQFTLIEFMSWYAKNASPTNTFSYTADWVGFNVPSAAISDCYATNVERTPYDQLMLDVCKTIEDHNGSLDYYLIGSQTDNRDVISHELAHGLFAMNRDYCTAATEIVTDPNCAHKAQSLMVEVFGYVDSVWIDETQAYLATGLLKGMGSLRRHRKPMKSLFDQYSSSAPPTEIYEGHSEIN